MKKISITFLSLIGLVFVAATAYFGIILIKLLWNILLTMNSDLAVAIIAGAVTIFVSTLTIILGKRYENAKLKQERLSEKKIPVYDEITDFYLNDVLDKKKLHLEGEEQENREQELVERISKITRLLISWGSDEVIVAWSELRNSTLNYDKVRSEEEKIIQSRLMMNSLAKLLLVIRKDTGHKNQNLDNFTILSLFLNDITREQVN